MHSQKGNNGSLAEWLGTGLQNRLQRFESARNLQKVHEKLNSMHFFCTRQWRRFANGGV